MAANDKKLLVGGCSFTAHTDSTHLSWANQLRDNEKVALINTAQMGSGNQIICDRICYELSRKEVRKSLSGVVVMWSSPFRKEFLFTHQDPDWRTMYRALKGKTNFRNYMASRNNGSSECNDSDPMSNWLIIGGGYGVWDFGVPNLDHRIKSYFENNFSKAQCYVDMCRAIVMVQMTCAAYKIPLLNMGWQNIFHDLHINEMMEGDQKDRNLISIQSTYGWLARRLYDNYNEKPLDLPTNMMIEFDNKKIEKMYPDCKHWVDMIDWSTWMFYEKEKKIVKGGLQEWRYFEMGEKKKTLQYHPKTHIQREWMMLVKKELIERGMIGDNNV